MTAPAPKPAKLPRWAETAPGAVSGDIVEPSSGKKDIGFIPGERPPAEYLDWLFSLNYEWAAYLNDADLTVSGMTIPSTNVAIANATIDDWDPGSGSLAGLYYIRMTGGGASAMITSIAYPTDGRVLILANETFNPILLQHLASTGTAGHRIQLALSAPSGSTTSIPRWGVVALRFDSGGGLTNKWRVIWANCRLSRVATRTQPFFAGSGWNYSPGALPAYTTPGSQAPVNLVGAGTYYYPIQLLDMNEQVLTVTVYGDAITHDATVSLETAVNSVAAGFAAVAGATGTITSGGIDRTVVLTPTTPAALLAGQTLWLKVVLIAGGTADLVSMDVTSNSP